MSDVQLPEDFRRLGFSGLFSIETDLTGTREEWEAAPPVPRFIHDQSWVLASVDLDTMTGVLVQRDDVATVAALTRRSA